MKKDPLLFWLYFFVNGIVLVILILLKNSLGHFLNSLIGLVILSFIILLFLSSLFYTFYKVVMFSLIFLFLGFLLLKNFPDSILLSDLILIVVASFLLIYHFKKLKKTELSFTIEKSNLIEQINDLNKKYKIDKTNTKALKNKVKRYKELWNIAEDLSSTLSLDEMSDRMLFATTKIIKAGDCWRLFLLDKDLRTLFLFKEKLFADSAYTLFADPNDWANRWILNNRIPLIIEDLKEDFRFEQDEKTKFLRSMIAVPLITDDKILGVLRMESSKEHTFQIEDLRLLAIISNISAPSIQNIYLYRDTHELSIRDGLTNLFVQKFFREKLKQYMKNIKTSTVSVIMADIDNFKSINDWFGHTIGDTVIMKIAKIITDKVKDNPVVARYGGEEFAIFYTNYPLQKVIENAEEIRNAIEKADFAIRREEVNITMSLGVAHNYDKKTPVEDFIHMADKALYKAKKKGKNCVVIAK